MRATSTDQHFRMSGRVVAGHTVPSLGTSFMATRLPQARHQPTTDEHSERVAWYAVVVGERLGLARRESEILRLGALLHDVGKRAIPDALVLKPATFTTSEFALMKLHTVLGE